MTSLPSPGARPNPTPLTPEAARLLERLLEGNDPRALEKIFRWLLDASPAARGSIRPRTLRLQQLLAACDLHPQRERLRSERVRFWSHPSATRVFTETGLPQPTTLGTEVVERLIDRLVPRLLPEEDLFVMLSQLELKEADAEWVDSLPDDMRKASAALLRPTAKVCFDAACVLAIRVSALGLARSIIELSPERPENASPFFRFAGVVQAFAAAPADAERQSAWEGCLGECRAALAGLHRLLEERGVSTELIFRLDLLEAQLRRIEELIALAVGQGGGQRMMVTLIRGSFLQRGVRSLLRNAAKRLARKVVEHTASTGEHYLVKSRADWEALGLGAVGGGFITAFTALGKYAAGALPLAPLVLGFALAGDYAGSFIMMQLFHFTLASKQPAMTAAALAANLEHGWHQEREVELVAAITRSQSIATMGNIAMAMPTAFLLNAMSQAIAGHSLLSEATAHHTVASLHPFLSLTIPFAALTGGFLWLASLGAGWAANWSGFRQLPKALAQHRGLNRLVGPARAAAIGDFTEEHFSGMVGYIVLGFLLGFVPVLFDKFFGIPIEVRHVTLSAASLALGAASLLSAGELHGADLAWGLLGIVVIGVLNFGISFSLALRTAMRARDLSAKERSALWRALIQAFRASPKRFLWKPAE